MIIRLRNLEVIIVTFNNLQLIIIIGKERLFFPNEEAQNEYRNQAIGRLVTIVPIYSFVPPTQSKRSLRLS